MTWTYDAAPSDDTPEGLRDAVRVLVGDVNTLDQQVQDEVIAFFLNKFNDEVYSAASMVCRVIAANYARLVDTKIEETESKFSLRVQQYDTLARHLERLAQKFGSSSVGIPMAGGILLSEMQDARNDADRVPATFKVGQFSNPPFGLPVFDGGDR